MAQSTLDNGTMNARSELALESKYGQMVLYTKGSGWMEKQTAREGSFTQMAIFIRDNGKTTKHMVRVSTGIWTGQSIKETGMKTSSMEKEKRHGQTNRSMMGIS